MGENRSAQLSLDYKVFYIYITSLASKHHMASKGEEISNFESVKPHLQLTTQNAQEMTL